MNYSYKITCIVYDGNLSLAPLNLGSSFFFFHEKRVDQSTWDVLMCRTSLLKRETY